MSTGRRPASSERSAPRAEALAERTELNVATASTRVPPAVASAEIVAQSAIGGRRSAQRDRTPAAGGPSGVVEAARASGR